MKIMMALAATLFGGFMGVQEQQPKAVTICEAIGCKAAVVMTPIGGCAAGAFVTDATVKTDGKCICDRPFEGAPPECIPDPQNRSFGRRCTIIGQLIVTNPAAPAGGFGGPGDCVCVGGVGIDAGTIRTYDVNLGTGPDCPGGLAQGVFDIRGGACVPQRVPLAPLCPAGPLKCRIVVSLICLSCHYEC
ncbi:MAG: hypothetical protein KDC98_18175 [Planctomycetes bacterium]|nr:hypothetical protein [Planctomycetota bacterium]